MTGFALPVSEIICALIIGAVLSVVYLSLLWLTVKHLPKIQHKGLFLFLSAAVRIALFLFGAVWFSLGNPARFLWVVLAFIVTRLVIVGNIKQRKKK